MDLTLLKQLREQTGAGVGDCQDALKEAHGDLEKAVEVLRKKGQLKAVKKAEDRSAVDGLVTSYLHATGKIGALVELRCETDFVARSDAFRELAKDIAMQVASENPLYMETAQVPAQLVEKEKEIYREQLAGEGKPADVVEKIIRGKLAKFFSEVCLLEQPFIKDDSKKVNDLIGEAVLKLGEKIEVGRFVRFQI